MVHVARRVASIPALASLAATALAVTVAGGSGCSSSSAGPSMPTGFSSSSALCKATGRCVAIDSTAKETDIAAAFASTKAGDTLAFGPGTYKFRNQLALGSGNGVTVVGSGQGETVLDFGGQVAAGDSLYAANVSDLTFEGFTVQNSPGNGIKTEGVTGVVFRDLTVTWLGLNSTDGGGVVDWDSGPDGPPPPPGITDGPYGLYPVQSKDILIERCSISGASDSGIYVGQSSEIVVRGNEAFANVAGIEIENSSFADVYDNYAHDNTGGILIFALPGLMVEGGHDVRVFSNDISANDRPNFAKNGDIVGLVPAGTGFFVMANDRVEVFGNTIEGNGTAGVGILSYFLPGLLMPTMDTKYYEYPSNTYVHDNVYQDNGSSPDTTGPTSGQIGQIIASGITTYPGMRMPDVSYDGVADPAKASMGANPMQICVHEAATTTFCDGHYDMLDVLGLASGTSNEAAIATCTLGPFACTLPALPAVTFPGLTP